VSQPKLTFDIYRVVAARFFSRAGSEAAFFVGVWGKAAFEFDASATELAIIMLILSAGTIAGSLVAGVLVDRFGPRRVLMVAEVFFVPSAISLAFTQNLTQLALLVGIWAFIGAPVVTAGASFAPFLITGEIRLERVNSWIEGAGALAFAVGPAVGALIVRYGEISWVFLFDAATSLVAALLVARVTLRRPVVTTPKEERHPISELLDGVRTVARARSLRYYVGAGVLVWLTFGAFGALEPLFFRDVVGTDIERMSWINAILGMGFLAGAALLPRLPRKIISARGLALVVALTGAGTVLYVGSPDLRIIAVGGFLWALIIGVLEPLLRTLLQRDAPPDRVGRVMGTTEVAHSLGELIPLAIAPALVTLYGVQAVLIGGGVLATIAAILSVGEARGIDRENADKIAAEVEVAGVQASDGPMSPNP
jgi:predicted MFS family arabinose efflux permease